MRVNIFLARIYDVKNDEISEIDEVYSIAQQENDTDKLEILDKVIIVE